MQQPNNDFQVWLFQINAEVFRLREALRAEAMETFPVRAHQARMQPGDRVILWQTGVGAACYALASIVEGPADIPVAAAELPFFRQAPEPGLRVRLKIDYNLWSRPLTPELLPTHPAFENFFAGGPGLNFRASSAQYRQLVQLIQQQDLLQEPEVPYGRPERHQHPLNLILVGPPGTGKTYQSVDHALAVIENRSLDELLLEERAVLRSRFRRYIQEGRLVLTTFHPSFSYEDFIEGLRPVSGEAQVGYEVQPGIFQTLCRRARQSLLETYRLDSGQSWLEAAELPELSERVLDRAPRYVLLIDEINRGNLASIFGELITLIDPDKREGLCEALRVTLPYSKAPFSVPPNLHLIGTMNSTDRSAEPLDVALRRRFAFRSLRPEPALIPRLARQPIIAGVDLQRLLRTLNERVALLLDPDFCIGHGYFLDVASLDDLRRLFDRQLIPLLREYFFNDMGKIALVLGPAFFRPQLEGMPWSPPFPNIPLPADVYERPRLELKPPEEWEESVFAGIYESPTP